MWLRLERSKADLIRSAERLHCAIKSDIDRRNDSLSRIAAQLDAMSPLKVLSRGYSLTLKADGATVVRSSKDVRPGDLIRTRLATGIVASRVIESP